jgi:hypothetical protein
VASIGGKLEACISDKLVASIGEKLMSSIGNNGDQSTMSVTDNDEAA